jgi:4-amino-4-deoxy-L-arabinose transferase-like glycosyltransferase
MTAQDNDTVTSRVRKLLGALLALAFCLRVGYSGVSGLNKQPAPGSDAAGFVQYAWNVAQGRGYRGASADVTDQDHLTSYQAPGVTFMYAALFKVFGKTFWPLRLTQALLDSATVLLLFLIARRLFNTRVGLLAALVYAVYPFAIFLSSELLSETLFTFLSLAFVLCCLQASHKQSPHWLFSAGLLFGLSMLTRPNQLLLVPFCIIWIWQTFRKCWQWRYLLSLPVAILTVLPWTARNYFVHHQFVPLTTTGGIALLAGNNRIVATDPKYYGFCVWPTDIPEYHDALKAPNNEVEHDRVAKRLAIQWLKNNPDKWWYLIQAKFRRFWTPLLQQDNPKIRLLMFLSWTPILVFFTPAFFATFVRFWKHAPAGLLLHYNILASLLTALICHALVRYRFPIEPFCIIMAGASVIWMWDKISQKTPAPTPQAIPTTS